MKLPWRLVWIIGASSGIGSELAKKLSLQGVKVAISSRSRDKLTALVIEHENIFAYPMDSTDQDAVENTAYSIFNDLGHPDLVIYNAGFWKPQNAKEFEPEIFKKTMDVNFMGAVFMLKAILPKFQSSGQGHIALVSSVAGYRGLYNASAYGASKAALIYLAESLKPEFDQDGINLSIVNPGFVKTPMTDKNDFPMPFIISAERAADLIIEGLKRKKTDITFPWQMRWWFSLIRILPYAIYFKLAPQPPKK